MSAYVVVEVDVTDPVRYEEYKKMVPPTIAQYDGKFLVRGGAVETLEGGWSPKRFVILEFPNAARAQAWYESAEYRPARDLRQSTSNGKMILVEGIR
ncbi:MAG: DUF1330 domain-containing protein [Chloroflexi bacterium]|nr:DUF1330 domain-containing protein [Chloroflexota bacterium]